MLSLRDIQSIELSSLVTSTGVETADVNRLNELVASDDRKLSPQGAELLKKCILNVRDGLSEEYSDTALPGVADMYQFSKAFLGTPLTDARFMNNLLARIEEVHDLCIKRAQDASDPLPTVEQSVKTCVALIGKAPGKDFASLRKFLVGGGVAAEVSGATIASAPQSSKQEQAPVQGSEERALAVMSQVTPDMRAALGTGMTLSNLTKAIQLLNMDLGQVQGLAHVAKTAGVSPKGYITLRTQGESHDMILHVGTAVSRMSQEFEIVIEELIDRANTDQDTIDGHYRAGRIVPFEDLVAFAKCFGFDVAEVADAVAEAEDADTLIDDVDLDDDLAEALQTLQQELREAPVRWICKQSVEVAKGSGEVSRDLEVVSMRLKSLWSVEGTRVLEQLQQDED